MGNVSENIVNEVKKAICGKDYIIGQTLTSILAGGHILMEDVPGVGKTTLALAFSKTMGLDYGRVQFTPDVLPSDITGFSMYDKRTDSMKYQPGAVFHNLFLADELNRASSRTQSALLEAMEESKVTVDGSTYLLPKPFIVIATQNPAGSSGTSLLPDSQVDRFMIRMSIGYPSPDASADMASRFLEGRLHGKTSPVLNASDIIEMRGQVCKVTIHSNLIAYAAALIDATRRKAEISCGASPRALLSLLRYAQATAFLDDRSYCIPEDIASSAALTLPHRLILTSGARLSRTTREELLSKILTEVKVP